MNKLWNKKRPHEDSDHWQSGTDILAALLMVIMLIMMILLMYIVKIPEEDMLDPYIGDKTSEYDNYHAGESSDRNGYDDDAEEDGDEKESDGDRDNHGGGGGGGGRNKKNPYDENHKFDEEGTGEWDGKSAVYVRVVDQETNSTIKEAGIRFELYATGGELRILHTYYPEKIEYREYETTEDGIFYLPEKVVMDQYYLHELSVPKGYDLAENTEFSIVKEYDWNEPYVVTIPLSPCKNKISVQCNDLDTRDPLKGVSYDIIAKEDIMTADGTLRYQKSEVVDTIVTNKKGYAESKELYLGQYIIAQEKSGKYYADLKEPILVELESKEDHTDKYVYEILPQKTTAVVHVKDELYNNINLEKAAFKLTCENNGVESVVAEADENGKLVFTDLVKNATYHLTQTSTTKGYLLAEPYAFTVDEAGYIADEIVSDITITNRTLRVSIGVEDLLFGNQITGKNITIYDANGNVVDTWTSNGVTKTLNGYEQGGYYMIIDGKEASRIDFTVQDQAEIQEYTAKVITNNSLVAFFVMGLVALIVLGLLIRGIRKSRKKKLQQQESNEKQGDE